jgi:hypothetical protein
MLNDGHRNRYGITILCSTIAKSFFDIGDAERFGGVSMKISFVLELILAVAFGLTLARLWQGVYFSMAGFGMISCSFITGFTIVQTIGLWIEKMRRRGPPTWGIGRITLSILGLVCLVQWPWDTAWYVLRQYGDPTASVNDAYSLWIHGWDKLVVRH